MKTTNGIFAVYLACFSMMLGAAPAVRVEVEIPQLQVATYHKPYLAIWIENTQRKGVKTVAVWYEQDEWLKDLRQWWRRLGRAERARYDAVTGATRKPGVYTFVWNGRNQLGNQVPDGTYVICIEAAREAGGREVLRFQFDWNESARASGELLGSSELGAIRIVIQ